jgi:hypothetical protein
MPSIDAPDHGPKQISVAPPPASIAETRWRCVDHALDPLLEELSRLGASATSADAAARFDGLLRGVGRALCRVLGLSRCSVYLTPDACTFHRIVGFDTTPGRDDKGRTGVVDATTDRVTAELVRTRAPVVVADARTDARLVASTVLRLGIRDLVAVPLITGGTVIGAVYLDGGGRAHQHARSDVLMAAALARRAAALVRQGQVVLSLLRCIDKAGADREVLERTSRGQLSVDAAAILGGCPSQLVAHLAETLDRPVLLLGPGHELLHIAGTDEAFAGAVRRAWRPAAFTRHANGTAAVLPPAPLIGLDSRQLVSSVEGGGTLVALEIGRRFDDADRRVVDRAAAVLRMKGRARAGDAPGAATGSFGALAAASAAERVGFPVVIVWLSARTNGATHEATRALGVPGGAGVVVPRPSGTGVVVHAADPGAVAATLAEADTPGIVVVSRVVLTPAAMAVALAEVDAVSQMLEHNGVDDRILAIDELGAARLVLANGTAASVAPIVEETLAPLLSAAVGPALSTVLLETARTLIATDGSIREAARRLDVHENTVRYRARRLRELTKLDVAAAGDLFQLHVALRAWERLGFRVGCPP